MCIIKSFSVGDGDMFCIYHKSGEITMIDCFYDSPEQKRKLKNFIESFSPEGKRFIRYFISTHPDEDHIKGIQELDNDFPILRFYSVYNQAKKDEETSSFKYYKRLRDSARGFAIKQGLEILHKDPLNNCDYGFVFLWPNPQSYIHANELRKAQKGEAFNNISPIVVFRAPNGGVFMWMGDLESDYTEQLDLNKYIMWPKIDVLFAPHHGRASGKLSNSILKALDPSLIIVGEAPSADLSYYNGYNTITQNTAGDIYFCCGTSMIDIFTENSISFASARLLANGFSQRPSYLTSDNYCCSFFPRHSEP